MNPLHTPNWILALINIIKPGVFKQAIPQTQWRGGGGLRKEFIRLLPLGILFSLGFWWLAGQKDGNADTPYGYQSAGSLPQLFQFCDQASGHSLEDIQQLHPQHWQEVHTVNFGYNGGTGWARSDIYSPTQQTLLLELRSHFIDAVSVWLVAGTETVSAMPVTGHRKLSEKSNNPYMHRYFTFELPLEADQEYAIFIQGATAPGFPLKFGVRYWEPSAFMNYLRSADWGWAIFVGITLVAVFIALIGYIFHRQRIYLYYAGYVSSLTLYALLNDGWGIFLPDFFRQISNPIFIAHFLNMGICFLLLFSREFLVIPNRSPNWWLRLDPWWLWGLITVCIIITNVGYAQHHEVLMRLGYWLGILAVSAAGLIWAAYIWDALQRRFTPAWLLLSAQLLMLLFYSTNIFLVNMQALTLAYADMYVFRVALISELLVIAAGWVYRQKVIRGWHEEQKMLSELQKDIIRKTEKRLREKETKALKLENELYLQRERLARDLHDGIGSQLSHIVSRLDMLSLSPKPQWKDLARISDFARETNRHLRETVWVLNRENIPFDDFAARLYSFLRMVWEDRKTPKLAYTSHCASHDLALPPAVALHLLRITQEATINALKYAQASTVDVRLEQLVSKVRLTVSDDGRGLSSLPITTGYGLTNMQKRAKEMRGDFELTTNGSGTHIEVILPLTN